MKESHAAPQLNTTPNPLWTRDFTIITLGSVISMCGNAMSGFAMSLMVLDISTSTLLYAIYMSMYTIPQLIMPIISGAILDRHSRKVTIYTLDFISAGLYLIMAIVLATGWFSFPIFAIYCFILGSIQSAYMVAYESFYPLLISEGNYQKAYSIASVLEMSAFLMVPVSTFIYNLVGLSPLLAFNAISFFIAAVMETKIEQDEDYIVRQRDTLIRGASKTRQVLTDTLEGFKYLISERGLLAVALYFSVIFVTSGISQVITLPYFKNNFDNGEYIYMIVWGGSIVGRMIGGGIHYKMQIPAKWRFTVALCVYISNAVNEGFYLFMPLPLMIAMCFLIGIGGVSSYTIRVSATQSYVPDEKKGRFNGAFNMLATGGSLLGQIIAGLCSEVIDERMLLMYAMIVSGIAAIVIIGGSKQEVSKVYNRIQ